MSEENRSPENGGALGEPVTRRRFIKTSALVGGSALAATQVPWLLNMATRAEARYLSPTEEYLLAKPENIIHTVCLSCHVRCPIKAKFFDGVLTKIDGSPFAAKTFLPNTAYDTPPAEAALMDGHLCPKGQAGVQIYYDPYRVRRVLKRAGPRGGGRWQTVDFQQAIDEIANGGDLFGEGPVLGLKDIFVLRDAQVAKAMAEDVTAIRKKEMTVGEFKAKHSAHLDVLIDPDHPDLGPKNNQLVIMNGRIQHGRKDFAKRWLNDGFGSVNFFEHTTICEQSHHIATEMMCGGKEHFKPDFLNAEFVIFWGTGAFEANFGSTAMAQLVTRAQVEKGLKVAVIDPRLSKTAAKAWKWVPVRPGADADLAMGMIRRMIETERYDARYLENANQSAAEADGETTSSDATHLVRTDEMVFLRAEDIGLPVPEPAEGEEKPDYFVVMTDSGLQRHDEAEHGLLEVDTVFNDIPVKSVFTLLKERAQEKSLDEYADAAGVEVHDIEELADELTAHDKKAGIDTYRGLVQHTNGYYAQQAVMTLNLLIGNVDWKGGIGSGGGHWHEAGDKEGQPYNLKELHPGKIASFGVAVTREKSKYDESTLFDRDGGFPAQRQWYPFSGNVYQEIIPSAGDGYPYPIKALFIHKGTPILSAPFGADAVRTLADPQKIPLVIADDVVIGETSMYCDYIFPDLTYLERWGTPHDNPQPATKNSLFRQPAASPLTEVVNIDGEEMPISYESVLIAIAKELGMPGYGVGGFGPNTDFDRPEDYYLKMAANIAWGDKPDGDQLPEAGPEEMQLLLDARRHLPSAVFDEQKWISATGEEHWPHVVTMLNRGGRFEAFDKAYDGDYLGHKYGSPVHLYVEKVAKARDAVTGERFDGLARAEPIRNSNGEPLDDSGYGFSLITFKEMHGGHSRTIPTYWTNISLMPENHVIMNQADADRLGLGDDDEVRLVSRSNPDGIWDLGNGDKRPVSGKVRTVEGMRPGVVAVSWHYGHWAYGARDVVIDGETIEGDERRGRGLCPNAVMQADSHSTNTCLTDPIGGSASFYDTRVNLVKV